MLPIEVHVGSSSDPDHLPFLAKDEAFSTGFQSPWINQTGISQATERCPKRLCVQIAGRKEEL